MIKDKHWHQIPSPLISEVLPTFRWSKEGEDSPASGVAALMLYVALNFAADSGVDKDNKYFSIASCSYVDLWEMTGLSRKLISAGLSKLVFLGLITPEGSHQKRRYRIVWPEERRFFKLPCNAIISRGEIIPFKAFTMRSMHELHAMKLYLYLASVRPNYEFWTQVSYEMIYLRLGISERHIKRATSLLLATGLLQSVEKTHSMTTAGNEANKYFLAGFSTLVRSAETSSEGGRAPLEPPF